MVEPQISFKNMRKERIVKEDGRFLYLYHFDENVSDSDLNRPAPSSASAEDKKSSKSQKTAGD
ncbi:MAG: hypothetical protein M1330_03040 [Armatimonadetes bacterium]|nr:hypothetical protein [Armatimonadota bacterium]